ncbi:hypothetical protein ACOME3_009407 [Neoechinorhynchus agilis]
MMNDMFLSKYAIQGSTRDRPHSCPDLARDLLFFSLYAFGGMADLLKISRLSNCNVEDIVMAACPILGNLIDKLQFAVNRTCSQTDRCSKFSQEFPSFYDLQNKVWQERRDNLVRKLNLTPAKLLKKLKPSIQLDDVADVTNDANNSLSISFNNDSISKLNGAVSFIKRHFLDRLWFKLSEIRLQLNIDIVNLGTDVKPNLSDGEWTSCLESLKFIAINKRWPTKFRSDIIYMKTIQGTLNKSDTENILKDCLCNCLISDYKFMFADFRSRARTINTSFRDTELKNFLKMYCKSKYSTDKKHIWFFLDDPSIDLI